TPAALLPAPAAIRSGLSGAATRPDGLRPASTPDLCAALGADDRDGSHAPTDRGLRRCTPGICPRPATGIIGPAEPIGPASAVPCARTGTGPCAGTRVLRPGAALVRPGPRSGSSPRPARGPPDRP